MGIYEAGQLVAGRYRIISPLSQGGMGAVYLADQVSLGREVALKVILNGRAGADAENRFDAEARAVCQLRHPNIITYHDYGRDEHGRPFLVMEFLPGYDGTKLVNAERMPTLVDLVHVVGQVCSALHEAHTKGIIHRDLKWSNVMVVPQSHDPLFTKLIDFGILKVAPDGSSGDQRKELTRTGVLLGTPQYMSPEAICGQPIDGRADVYSLGVMTWELLCGHRPFQADSNFELLRMHVQAPRPPMDTIRSVLAGAPDLEPAVLKAMAQQPAERYASALDFHAALAAAVGVPGPSRTSPARRRGRQPDAMTPAVSTPYQRPGQPTADPRTPYATPYSHAPSTDGRAASAARSARRPPSTGATTAPPAHARLGTPQDGRPLGSSSAVALVNPVNPDTGVPLGSDVHPRPVARTANPPGYLWALGAVALAVVGFVVVLLATSGGGGEGEGDEVAGAPVVAPSDLGATEIGEDDPAAVTAAAADEAAADKAAADKAAADKAAADKAAADKAAADKAAADKAAADKAAADKAAADKAAADKAAADKAAADKAAADKVVVRPRATRYGTLTVSAIPYAEVTVNGKKSGSTPLKGLRVKAGTVRVVLEHPTYGKKLRSVRVSPDETKRITIYMNK